MVVHSSRLVASVNSMICDKLVPIETELCHCTLTRIASVQVNPVMFPQGPGSHDLKCNHQGK